ncbi:hypothetical protein [Microbacterium marinilacus]|uniref:HNH endonuclease n=1 Tax=Microbacterium marinilacus TaxID=415209 RepID=A0ABP7B3I7_9MICO|nr:hypothetical protein [Microbacterium marinilacus]
MTDQELAESARADQTGRCWWCGGIADSREHKHKRSALRRMQDGGGMYLGVDGQAPYRVRGPNSPAVKFKKILCRKCNNVRSQPFDAAYDEYWKYVQTNSPMLNRATVVDWTAVYGDQWAEKTRALGRYAIKNFGCWMAESGFRPPEAFVTFLNGGELADTRVVLARKESISLMERALRLDGTRARDAGMGVYGALGMVSRSRLQLTAWDQISYVSDICMHITWREDAGVGDVFWRLPFAPLEVMPASMSQKMLAVKIGARALIRRVQRSHR